MEIDARDLDGLFGRLSRSTFRSRFDLGRQDLDYIALKGLDTVVRHAREFVDRRLGPPHVPNDGKQTPMRGHPVFRAQHATATCCRSCLYTWHGIAAGRELQEAERRYVVAVIERWLRQTATAPAVAPAPRSSGPPSPARPGQPDLFDGWG